MTVSNRLRDYPSTKTEFLTKFLENITANSIPVFVAFCSSPRYIEHFLQICSKNPLHLKILDQLIDSPHFSVCYVVKDETVQQRLLNSEKALYKLAENQQLHVLAYNVATVLSKTQENMVFIAKLAR